MNDLKKSIRSFVVESFLFGQEDELTDDVSFLDQGIIDSTGVLELVTHLEQTYNFTVEDVELVPENLDSIDSIVAFVQRKSQVAP